MKRREIKIKRCIYHINRKEYLWKMSEPWKNYAEWRIIWVKESKELKKWTGNWLNWKIPRVLNRIRAFQQVKNIQKFTLLKKFFVLISVFPTVSSKMTPPFKSSGKNQENNKNDKIMLFSNPKHCTNKVIQIAIACIVIMLALCLIAMATLYFLEIQKRNDIIK